MRASVRALVPVRLCVCGVQKGSLLEVAVKVPFTGQPTTPVSAFLLCAAGFFVHVIAAAYVYRASHWRKAQDAQEGWCVACV